MTRSTTPEKNNANDAHQAASGTYGQPNFEIAPEARHAVWSLVNYDYEWKNYINQPLKYSFTIPTNQSNVIDPLKTRVYSGFFFSIDNISPISKPDIILVKAAFAEISQYINLNFSENDQEIDMHVVGVTASPAPLIKYVLGSWAGDISGVGLTIPKTEERIVAYSTQLLASDLTNEMAAKKNLIIKHEICHTIGFRHPNKYLSPTENFNFFSIMIYKFFQTRFQGRVIPIIPKTLMPYDIHALQSLYGANLTTNLHDNIYHLADYGNLTDSFMNIHAIWDAGGEDTLSAEDQDYDALLSLREGSYHYSSMNTTYVALAYGSHIENVIGSNKKNLIFLNELANKVDIRKSKEKTTIVIDPEKTNNDIIFGFKTKKDTIVLLNQGLHKHPSWKMFSVGLLNLTFMQQHLLYKFGVKLIFDENNSLLLPGVKQGQISWTDIQLSHGITPPLFVFEYPDMRSISLPFIQSMLYTLTDALLKSILIRRNWSLRNIQMTTQVLQITLAFYQGSYFASIPATLMYLSSKFLSYSEDISKQVGSATAIVLATYAATENIEITTASAFSCMMGGILANTVFAKHTPLIASSIEAGTRHANSYLHKFGMWGKSTLWNLTLKHDEGKKNNALLAKCNSQLRNSSRLAP